MTEKNFFGRQGVGSLALFLLASALLMVSGTGRTDAAEGRPLRILFLGHDSSHHNSNEYFPILAQELGREAIYFDYQTRVADALERDYLFQFDGVLLYANHLEITPEQLDNLIDFVRSGRGFIPVHCASACFTDQRRYIELVGGRFRSHGGEVFSATIINREHPAMKGVEEFESWDETYVHDRHNETNRTVLMVRKDRSNPEGEPWTWVREEGNGRVFYTASGHDRRTWDDPGFHQMLKSGIVWAVGEQAAGQWRQFIETRNPLVYEERDNIPNYERRPQPLPYQLPLSVQDSLDYTRAPVDFDIVPFASEPMIVNPMAISWDDRGRLWVIESVDYPNEITSDRIGRDSIKILEDTNGDGRADKVTTFAAGLNIPTSLLCIDGGVIVFQAPDALFMKDTDGDDKVDYSEVLFTGFGMGDTHAGPSNLRYGYDNWIYGTVGYSRFRGTVGGEDHDFGMGVFRFKRDGSKMEFLHQFNNNTWGLGFNSDGEVFGSTANNNPSFFGGVSAVALGTPAGSAKMIADSPKFHPITPNIRQVDAFGAYTAGCGHAFAVSDAFPSSMRDRVAFVNGPTGNLTGMYRIEKDGAGYVAKNNFAFVASADEWFSPVAAEIGPDGHVWIADWYNFIIQHNPTPSVQRGGYDAQNGPGNAHINPNRDRMHGRIHRVVWKGAAKKSMVNLEDATVEELADQLANPNQFWRLTAQRKLIARGSVSSEVAQRLRDMVQANDHSSPHAFTVLSELYLMDRELYTSVLLAGNTAMKAFALKALPLGGELGQLLYDTAVLTDSDPRVRLAAFEKLAQVEPDEISRNITVQLLKDQQNRGDEWLDSILKICAARHGARVSYKLGENIVPNSSLEELEGDSMQPVAWRVRNYSGRSSHALDNTVAHSGSNSLRISSENGSDTSWHVVVPVKQNTEYRLSCWIRTENVRGAMGALMNVHVSPNQELTTAVSRTSDWQQVELMLNTGSRNRLDLNCLFGGWGRSTGTAWYDDIALQEVLFVEEDEKTEIAGDAGRGMKIFKEHPVAACNRCHKIDGTGGDIGPALDGLAARKSRDYIYESLVEPSATIAEGFTLQASPMPPMGLLLKPEELADVMAYLMTLE